MLPRWLSKLHLVVYTVTKISSKWRVFCYNVESCLVQEQLRMRAPRRLDKRIYRRAHTWWIFQYVLAQNNHPIEIVYGWESKQQIMEIMNLLNLCRK